MDGFSIGFIDNSEVAYFLLCHPVQCRSIDLPCGTGMIIPHSL